MQLWTSATDITAKNELNLPIYFANGLYRGSLRRLHGSPSCQQSREHTSTEGLPFNITTDEQDNMPVRDNYPHKDW
jgi:hypothetical protein